MSEAAAQALEIANLKARYCAAADLVTSDLARAQTELAAVFADDFVGEFGWGPIHGANAMAEFLAGAVAPNSAWMIHLLSSPRIEVSGTEATGAWTVATQMKRRDGGEVELVLGRYADEFRLGRGGWRIARIEFTQLT